MNSRSEGNNFNLLRLVLSLMVVVYHATLLPGVQGWEHVEVLTSLAAEIGVQGFFVLSGYLVWESLQRSHSMGLYAEKRARRLLPGYFAVVGGCAVAALAISPEARADLLSVVRYLGWNLVFLNFMEPDLPGLFQANRFTEVNGALWTLKIEVMFYLVLPALAWALGKVGRLRWVVLFTIYVAAEAWRAGWQYWGDTHDAAMSLEIARQLPGQMSFFATGMALAMWREKIKWTTLLVSAGVVLLILSVAIPSLDFLRAAGLGVTVVWIAVGLPRVVDAARFGDFSYGVYIVHFPIIQGFIAVGLFALSPWLGLVASIAATFLVAYLLWWLVERPALRADSAYRSSW